MIQVIHGRSEKQKLVSIVDEELNPPYFCAACDGTFHNTCEVRYRSDEKSDPQDGILCNVCVWSGSTKKQREGAKSSENHTMHGIRRKNLVNIT